MGLDPLTGLHDRSHLDVLEREFRERIEPWSLIMLDIDHFKLVNDIYGHLMGDEVLRQVALNLQASLKRTDTALRFGGDELMAVLPATTGDGALDLAQRLVYDVERQSFPRGLRVTVSLGVTTDRGEDSSLQDLVDRADKALYRAKESGRGRFFFYSEDLVERDSTEVSFTHMVGRRGELQKLRHLLEEAVGEGARFALISGEMGVGKSRLVDELLNYCDFMKAMVVRSTAAEHVGLEPYALLVGPLREALDRLSTRELDRVRRRIEPVHPATLELFPELRAESLDDTMYFREERLRFRIFQDIAVLVSSISASRPLVMVLDNLQWAGEPDVSILSFVARNTADAHVMYVCLLRPSETERETMGVLRAIRSSVPLLQVELGNLTPHDARNMILFALKDPNVPKELQDFLISQSGCNPLFLRELLESMVASGHISTGRSGEKNYALPEERELPETLAQVVTARLSGVDEQTRDLLRIASLSPERLSIPLLEAVTGTDQVELARRIDRCIQVGLLEEVRQGGLEVGLRFAHGAVRDFLASGLPGSLRQTYHMRMASYFRLFYEAGSDELLAAVAYHYAGSLDDENAARFSLLAARQAFSRGANRDAVRWYREYLRRVDEEAVGRVELFRAHVNLGMLCTMGGRTEEAHRLLERALQMAGMPEEEAAVHYRLGRNYHNRSMFPEALSSFDRAVSLCSESDGEGDVVLGTMVDALLWASFIMRMQGRYDEAMAAVDRADELLGGLDSERVESLAGLSCARRADVLSDRGQRDDALLLYEKALSMSRDAADIHLESLVLNNMHGLYGSRGDYPAMLEALERALELSRRMDERIGMAIAYYNLAEYHQTLNMTDLAEDYYRQYMELNDTIGNELGIGYGRFGLGSLQLQRGDLDAARGSLEGALEVFGELGCTRMCIHGRLMLAGLALRAGDCDEALALLPERDDDGWEPAFEGERDFTEGLILLECAGSGAADDAERALELLRRSVSGPDGLEDLDIPERFGTLARALLEAGRAGEADDVLRKGAELLSRRLARIPSYTVRRNLMSRPELGGFQALCRERRVAPGGEDGPAGG